MGINSLLDYKKNIFSQNGEDGVIERVFQLIGSTNKKCCEFGAWDGIHLSNCRQLILNGWDAVLIEGDEGKSKTLCETYRGKDNVFCINRYVDINDNRLSTILKEVEAEALDFLSIDIDGRDWEILQDLDIYPRVICIEVNAGHSPRSMTLIPADLASENVGQTLAVMTKIANEKGYELVCYTGNAFYVRRDALNTGVIVPMTNEAAYQDFVEHLTDTQKEWLFLVNCGVVSPYHKFHNPFASYAGLRIKLNRALGLISRSAVMNFSEILKSQIG